MNLEHGATRIVGCKGMDTETFKAEVLAMIREAYEDGKLDGYARALEEMRFETLIKQGTNDN